MGIPKNLKRVAVHAWWGDNRIARARCYACRAKVPAPTARPADEVEPNRVFFAAIHRPARDIIPPLGGSPGFLLSDLILSGSHAAVTFLVHRNLVPSTRMRCTIRPTDAPGRPSPFHPAVAGNLHHHGPRVPC